MRFYKMVNIIKTTNILSSQKNKKNKQFIMLENRSFLMGALLLKYPKFDQKLIVLVKKFLFKVFNNKNKIYLETLCANVITFFDATELYKLLSLRKDIDIYIEKLSVSKYGPNKKVKVINKDIFKISRLNKKAKKYLHLYLCIVNYFFNYIGFPKMINVLKKVLLYSSKENKMNNLKIMLEKLGKIYSRKLKINSLC